VSSLRRILVFVLAATSVLVPIVACSDDPTTGPSVTPEGGADSTTPPAENDAATGADTNDPAKKDASLAPTGKTAVTATLNGVSRNVVRAQFGKSVADAAKETFRIEAHDGGDPACPSQSSPTPKRTLLLAGVPRGFPGTTFTKADGVSATFFDFADEQLEGAPLTKATAVTVTIVALDVPSAPPDGSAIVEIEVDATFAEGTVKGRVAATYCGSLSD